MLFNQKSKAFAAAAILGNTAAIADLVGALPRLRKLQNILNGRFCNILQGFVCKECLVRRNDNVGHGNQTCKDIVIENVTRIVFEEEIGFFLVNVKASGSHVAGFDSREECLGIDQRSARGVDKHHTATAKRQRFFIYHMVGLIGQGTVQRDNITLCKKFGLLLYMVAYS